MNRMAKSTAPVVLTWHLVDYGVRMIVSKQKTSLLEPTAMTVNKLKAQIDRLENEIAEYRLELKTVVDGEPVAGKRLEMLQDMIANANEAIMNRMKRLTAIS